MNDPRTPACAASCARIVVLKAIMRDENNNPIFLDRLAEADEECWCSDDELEKIENI